MQTRPAIPLTLMVTLTTALILAACRPEPAAVVPPALELDPDGTIRLQVSADPAVALDGLTLRLRLQGRWYGPAELGPPTLVDGGDDGSGGGGVAAATLRWDGQAARLSLRVTPPAKPGDPLLLEPTVEAPAGAAQPLQVQALELVVPPGGLELPRLARAGELLFLQNGYQSWSFTGALRLRPPFASPLTSRGEAALGGGLGDPIRSLKGVGWWFGLLAAEAKGPALVVGAAGATRHRLALLPALPAAGSAGLTLRLGTTDEVVPVKAGAALALEPLVLVAAPGAEQALQAYVAAVGRAIPAAAARRAEAVADPTGWWSWNVYFDEVTETKVLRQAAFVQTKLAQHGHRLIELDDGYELLWGDWERTDPERFPAGLSGLSASIRARGLGVGLWLAPLLVDRRSTLATQHPEWFVADLASGKPLEHTQLGVRGTTYVLDPTHPGAAAHLRGLFARLAAAGVTLFKLDFLYAGALPGRRHQSDVTGIEALGRALELIRQAAPAAHINLCGMPWLPALGRGHSLRYGTDIAFTVAKPGLGQIAHEARNVMLRSFFDPLIRNDPDQVLVRPPLTLDEARLAATLGAMAGFFTSGDEVSTLPAERLALLTHPDLLALARGGRSALPLDVLGAAGEEIYLSPVTDPGLWLNQPRTAVPTRYLLQRPQGGAYLALFNWGTTPRSEEVDLAALGHAGAAVTEVWSGASLAAPGGTVRLQVRPHAAALLRLAP